MHIHSITCIVILYFLSIINFGVTADTFGVLSTPSSPIGTSKATAPEDEEDLPALVFISAVDPSIPITSNKQDYSKTLPSRQKLPRADLLQTSFEAPENAPNSDESLFKTDLKASKSTGAINKVLSSQPLRENLRLGDTTKQKANSRCLQLPVYDAPTTTETFQSDPHSKPRGKKSDGYVFMEPIGRSVAKQPSLMGDPITCASLVNTADMEYNRDKEAEGFYNIPKPFKLVKGAGSGGQHLLTEKEADSGIPAVSSVDTSHYDVPRKLLQERAASMKQESKVVLKEQGILKSSSPPKPPRKTSLNQQASSGDILHPLEMSIPKEAEISKPHPPSRGNLTKTISTVKSDPTSKPEGIYDVPRSLLKLKSETDLLHDHLNSGAGEGQKEAEVASQAPSASLIGRGRSSKSDGHGLLPVDRSNKSPVQGKEPVAEKPKLMPKPSSFQPCKKDTDESDTFREPTPTPRSGQ